MTCWDGVSAIDLNADVGECLGVVDEQLMPLVTSANIACGAHAGDDASMAHAVALARQHRVAVGAHPGHADREHFGRREIFLTPERAAALVLEQVAALERIAGEPPRHVKLHGGLYHQVARDRPLAVAVADAIAERWPTMDLLAPAGSLLADAARARGIRIVAEAFVDRAYLANGFLVPRSVSGAVITDPQEAARRAVLIVRDGVIETADGSHRPIQAHTLCIHGDGPDPGAIARAVRAALEANGITIRTH